MLLQKGEKYSTWLVFVASMPIQKLPQNGITHICLTGHLIPICEHKNEYGVVLKFDIKDFN